jgi:hypothetical protein
MERDIGRTTYVRYVCYLAGLGEEVARMARKKMEVREGGDSDVPEL